MFTRSFVSILIVATAAAIAFGQTPEAKKDNPDAARTFAFAFAGDGGYLGVQTREVNKENFAKFGLSDVRGVAVEKVIESSPASAAGVMNGDVIVKFNGESVTSSKKLTRLVSEVAPDHKVTMTVLRSGSEKALDVTVGSRPAAQMDNGSFDIVPPAPIEGLDLGKLGTLDGMRLPDLKNLPKGEDFRAFSVPGGQGKVFSWNAGNSRQIGIGVYPVTKQLGEKFGVDGGVMVNDVRADSPAAKAGVKAGDIIVEANGKAVKGDMDLIREINEQKTGDVTLTVIRDQKRQTITVTPEKAKDSGYIFEEERNGDKNAAPMPGRVNIAPLERMAIPMRIMKMFDERRII